MKAAAPAPCAEMVAAQISMCIVPVVLCMFLANFGVMFSDVIRMVSVWNAASTPVLLPIVLALMSEDHFSLTVPDFLLITGAIMAGSLAVYVAANNRGFGLKLQAMGK